MSSWKAHLATIRSKKSLDRGDGVESTVSAGVNVVSPDAHTSYDFKMYEKEDNSLTDMVNDSNLSAIVPQREEESELLYAADPQLQKRILEITASTTWLSYAEDGEDHEEDDSLMDKENRDMVDSVAKMLHFGADNSKEDSKSIRESITKINDTGDSTLYEDTFIDDENSYTRFEDNNNNNDNNDNDDELNSNNTPPNTPGINKPALADFSPSTRGHATVTPSQIILPSDKASNRISVSPTRSRGDSEFGKQLERASSQDDAIRKEKKHAESPYNDISKGGGSGMYRCKATGDEYKAAITTEGRTYYYNRRTRESLWRLPTTCVEISLSVPPEKQSSLQKEDPFNSERKDLIARERKGEEGYKAQHALDSFTTADNDHAEPKMDHIFCMFCAKSVSCRRQEYSQHLAKCERANITTRQQMQSAVELHHFFLRTSEDYWKVNQIENDILNESNTSQADENINTANTDAKEDSKFESCIHCGRTFTLGRKAKHEAVCQKLQMKRTPYDTQRKRILGTPLEFAPASPYPPPNTPSGNQPPDTPKRETRNKVSPVKRASPKQHQSGIPRRSPATSKLASR